MALSTSTVLGSDSLKFVQSHRAGNMFFFKTSTLVKEVIGRAEQPYFKYPDKEKQNTVKKL